MDRDGLTGGEIRPRPPEPADVTFGEVPPLPPITDLGDEQGCGPTMVLICCVAAAALFWGAVILCGC